MPLHVEILKLEAAGSLVTPWTTSDLLRQKALTATYADTTLKTEPPNASRPAPGMARLGIGHHVSAGYPAHYLRVGIRGKAILFQCLGAADAVVEEMPESDEEEEEEEPVETGDAFTEITDDNKLQEDGESWLASDEHVRGLVEYLRGLLGDGPPFAHCHVDRKRRAEWQCLGLVDAADKYRYGVHPRFARFAGPVPHHTLAANALVLGHLQKQLRAAYAAGNELDAVAAAKDILLWGGVTRGNVAAVSALHKRGPTGFLDYLDLCKRSFGTGTSVSLTPFIGKGYGIRSNAGFTKIYSLLFDNFIIYDSRVAAALGFLVVRYLALHGHRHAPVPASLCFTRAAARAPVNSRDPGSNVFGLSGFPGPGGHLQHLKWNIRANALLTRVLAGSKFAATIKASPARFPVTPLRALEAALFMIGYDLYGNWPHYN